VNGYRIDITIRDGKLRSQYVWHDESAFAQYALMCRICAPKRECVELYDITTYASALEPISIYGTKINRH
jgi:hypothetical protein